MALTLSQAAALSTNMLQRGVMEVIYTSSTILDRLPFEDVASHGYCFQVDWAWRAVRSGARVVEVPITFAERTLGRSKMSGSIVREALVRVTEWGLRDRLADRLPGRVRRPVPGRTRIGG